MSNQDPSIRIELLRRCKALCSYQLTVNWQQYSKAELVDALKMWVDGKAPGILLDMQRGGRIQPSAWLSWLAAYRLWINFAGDEKILGGLKSSYTDEYQPNDHSIVWIANKFRRSILDSWFPQGLLPSID